MLLRFSLSAAGALLVASGAAAQSGEMALPIATPIKDAGTYHLGTNTWTRGSVAAAGASEEERTVAQVGLNAGGSPKARISQLNDVT